MGKVKIKDHVIWLRHIEGDPALGERIRTMSANEVLELEVNGIVGRWQRMRDGKDGRQTQGIKPIDSMREVWKRFRSEATGRIVDIREVRSADTYLAALTLLFSEWDSPEDEEAYRDL